MTYNVSSGTLDPTISYRVLWQLYCAADMVRYATSVCSVLCDYLDIRCFHVTPPTCDNVRASHVNRRPPASRTSAVDSASSVPSAARRSHAAVKSARAFHM